MTTEAIEKKTTEEHVDLPVFKPATDVYEKDDGVIIHVDMPGVDEKNVDVEVDQQVLTLRGNRRAGEESDPTHRGYREGNYERSFRLGDGLDLDSVKARMKNGVLTVELAKRPELAPRRIQVKTG
ncbi:MAG: Hsp20/alpha crystallin family protein [Verrucomicrobiota bacterium]